MPRTIRSLILIASCAVSVTTSTAHAASQSDALHAVFVSPGKDGEVFWDMVAETMIAAGGQIGVSVEVLKAQRNTRKMRQIGLDVVARKQKPDFLFLVNEGGAAISVLKAANDAKIKTLFVSAQPTAKQRMSIGEPRVRLPNWLGSVVPDMKAAGQRMGERLFQEGRRRNLASSDGQLHILALAGDVLTSSSIDRNNGLLKAVRATGDVKLDRLLVANWNRQDAEVLTQRYLNWAKRKGMRPAGIWAGNDEMAIGALSAISALENPIPVVGLNWSHAGLTNVQDGAMLLSDGGHFLSGAWTVIIARDYADGCDFAKMRSATFVFPTSAVDVTNVKAVKQIVANRKFDSINFRKLRASQGKHCSSYNFSLKNLLANFHPAPSH